MCVRVWGGLWFDSLRIVFLLFLPLGASYVNVSSHVSSHVSSYVDVRARKLSRKLLRRRKDDVCGSASVSVCESVGRVAVRFSQDSFFVCFLSAAGGLLRRRKSNVRAT